MIHATNSPNVAYENVPALPATGAVEANPAEHKAASAHAIAASTNATDTEGPEKSPAVRAVSVKMPAPITTATPKTVRSQALRFFLSLVPGSSVSAIDCSTDFVRHKPVPGTGPPHLTG